MTDYSILLSTQLDVSGIQAQLEELAGKYSINSAALTELQAQAQNIQTAVGETASKISISTTYKDGVQTATTSTKTFNDELGNTVKQVEAVKLGEDGTVVSTKNVTTSVLDLNKASETAFGGWLDQMGSVIQRTLQWSAALAVVYGAFRSIQEGTQYVIDLNAAMTNTEMITGQTSQQVQTLYTGYQNMAQQLGVTTMDIAQASDMWLRQGKSAQDAATLTQASIMMTKLSATDAATAASNLTAIMNGFQMQASQATTVLDKVVTLTNSTKTSAALSFNDLATAMQSSASIANQTGVSFDQLASYIATISTATQASAETVGNSLLHLSYN